MKTIILWLFLFITNALIAQYTLIPDPVFEIFLEANGMGDGIDNNGQVLTANIDTVTTLDLPSFIGLTDLTGIEDFITVEFLDFSYNNVIDIDLSQNTTLSILGCGFNDLTSLDLSNNTELTWVYCVSNSLTSLLLNSTNIHTIECYENLLPSLDVSQSTALEFLDCNSNQITNLDISQNGLLTKLNCSGNYLTSLNTTQNSLLTTLLCGYNDIVSLDLSNNINLNRLLCPFIEELSFLDMRNGNNANVGTGGFNVFGTDDLQCIFVDDASAEYLDDWYIDPFTTFVNNEQECEDLSVSSFEQDVFIVYPNPAQNILNISAITEANYTLFTTQGKIVTTGVLYEGTNTISLLNLSSGLYFLKVHTKNGVTTKKVIKE